MMCVVILVVIPKEASRRIINVLIGRLGTKERTQRRRMTLSDSMESRTPTPKLRGPVRTDFESYKSRKMEPLYYGKPQGVF
jgi:hypothetical protein